MLAVADAVGFGVAVMRIDRQCRDAGRTFAFTAAVSERIWKPHGDGALSGRIVCWKNFRDLTGRTGERSRRVTCRA